MMRRGLIQSLEAGMTWTNGGQGDIYRNDSWPISEPFNFANRGVAIMRRNRNNHAKPFVAPVPMLKDIIVQRGAILVDSISTSPRHHRRALHRQKDRPGNVLRIKPMGDDVIWIR